MNQLVLLINLIGLLLIDPFFLADISITQNLPTTMQPGSEFRVTVTVTKAELTGFAKLQLDLPSGLTATAIETKGASFTFADQKAKFIWMALPSTPTFKVTYTLTADATVSGNQAIVGRLSYIEDNERKTFDLPTSTIDFGSGITNTMADSEPVAAPPPTSTPDPVAATPVATVTTPKEPSSTDMEAAVIAAPAGKTAVAVIDQASGTASSQGPGGITASRTITPVTENEMLVEVIVKKGSIRGFGKLQETIPQGFTAMEKNSSDAIFTTQDRIAKFVWLNLPAGDEVKVVYKLRANEKPEGEYSIDGEFGYLLNDETQKSVIGTSKFFIGPKAMENMQAETAQEPVKEAVPVVVPTPPVQEPIAKDVPKPATTPAKQEPVAATKPTPPAKTGTSRIPAPENGVLYKVQISAGHREVGKSYFSTRHRFNGDFNLERHQGWVKYVSGKFGSYNEARDQRVAFVAAGHNFPGPFVTAYNNGDRITVQEALMLSNQKWVQ
ncbi:MAG: hypothetical protein IPO87_16055 [Flavobacteriales bacterium]|nr:hypothetical protein [Flavobacteriales bacterium]